MTREFLWVALGQGAAALGGIVGIRLLTHALPPEAYGELALGMTAALLVQQTILAPIAGAALRFFAPAAEAHQVRSYLRAVRALLGWATLAVIVVAALLGLGLALTSLRPWLWLMLAAMAFALAGGFGLAFDGMQNAARHRAVVAWHDGIGQWLRFLLAVGVIALFGSSSVAAMVGYFAAALVVLGSQALFFRQKILAMASGEITVGGEIARGWMRQMFDYGWPFATWGVFTWVQLASDRWGLQWFGTTRQVGLYAVLYQLGYYPVSALAGVLLQLVAPILFGRAGDGMDQARLAESRQWNARLVLGVLALTAVGVVAAALGHRIVAMLLMPPDYRQVSNLLPVIVLSSGLFASGQVASLTLMSQRDSRALMVPKILTALAGGTLNIAGAWWLGLTGVVTAGALFSVMYLAWVLWLVGSRGRKAR